MLLAGARAVAVGMAACGVDAAAVSRVAHSRSESCRDLVACAAVGVQLWCVLVRGTCGMCGCRDRGSVDCSLLGLRL
jgi:hypothetical protein